MNNIFKPKLFSVMKDYNLASFQKDLFAGIIVGIVALPLAIAFAVASGVSPEKGLITAIVAGFVISLLGGSRVQIGGPTGAFIIIVFGILNEYGLDGLLISTFLAGVILVIFGLLRMGIILKFIPHPLIVGFTSGIAMVIFTTQIKDAFGLTIESVPAEFIDKWGVYFSHMNTINFYAISLTIITILITVFSGKFFSKIPGSFIAILLITFVCQFFELPVSTIETLYGEIPTKIEFTSLSFEFSNLSHYIVPAFTIAILGAIESLLSAVVSDGMIGGNHRSNTELIAQGFANMLCPFFGGIPATGAIARTATNVKSGGRTPIAGIVHAFTLLLIMLVFGKWAKLIPMSCLAGILIVVSYNMSGWRIFRDILKGSYFDIVVLLSTFLLTVFVDLTIAIQVGVVLASFIFMYRMANINGVVDMKTHGDDIVSYKLPKGISVYEISGPFFFAAAKRYNDMLRDQSSHTQIIILRMRHVPFIDSTGMKNFKELILSFQSRNIITILSGVNAEVKKELVRDGIFNLIGEENVLESFDKSCHLAELKMKKD